jgi:hypothetical protein
MSQQHNNLLASKEAQIQLALQAIKRVATLTLRAAARIYSVSHRTLSNRRAGKASRRDTRPNSMRLLPTEEAVIVQHILNLEERGFPPRIAAVNDMADTLLAERGQHPIGKNWASTFVRRQLELRSRTFRKYDYQRALCEDPELVQRWFRLAENMKAKHGIQDEDTYNFDETGFMMGQISHRSVVSGAERQARPKLVQQGNQEWTTVIQGINAIGWAIPPFIIFQGKNHLSAWYKEDSLPQDWVIGVSENGWTTNKLGLE